MNTTLIELYLDREPYKSRIAVNGVEIPGVTAVNVTATISGPPEVVLTLAGGSVRVTAMASLGIEPEEPEEAEEKPPVVEVWGQ